MITSIVFSVHAYPWKTAHWESEEEYSTLEHQGKGKRRKCLEYSQLLCPTPSCVHPDPTLHAPPKVMEQTIRTLSALETRHKTRQAAPSRTWPIAASAPSALSVTRILLLMESSFSGPKKSNNARKFITTSKQDTSFRNMNPEGWVTVGEQLCTAPYVVYFASDIITGEVHSIKEIREAQRFIY